MSISFNQSTYVVNENDGLVEVVLVLNNLTGFDVTVQVANDNTATGEHLRSINIILLVIILQEEVILDHTM